jgi:predicted Holliday junction resolvase-like endonuclease
VAKKKIKNTKRKPNENSSYYFVGHVDSSGEVTPLLLTDVEYAKAKARALKNPEDTPTDFIVFSQAHKDK